jgi:tetratricopeptide (TPR) repeat protein
MHERYRWLLTSALASVTLTCFVAGNARAQPAADSGAQVQQLYSEAQAAKSRGDLAGAAAKYRSIVTLDPGLAPAYNNLGMLYLEMRDYAKAAEAFEAGLKRDPSMSPSLVLLGISYFQLRDYKRAQPLLERAVRALPKDEQARLYLGLCLSKTGQLDQSATILRSLTKESPANLEALYALGQLYMALAQDTFRQLAAGAPDSYLTHLVEGEAQEKMERYDDAVLEYKQAIERQPPGYLGLNYKLGNAYWLAGKWEEAIASFKQELAVDPRNCKALWKIGNIMVRNKQDSTEALSYLTRSLDACPDLVQAMVDEARLLSDKGDHQAALNLYKRAVELDPNEPSIHYQSAMVYRKLGQAKEYEAELALFQKLSGKEKQNH